MIKETGVYQVYTSIFKDPIIVFYNKGDDFVTFGSQSYCHYNCKIKMMNVIKVVQKLEDFNFLK